MGDKHAHAMEDETRVRVRSDADIVIARQKGREMALHAGFTSGESAVIAAAISELGRNIILHAQEGKIILKEVQEGNRRGILVTAWDVGPAIPEIDRALKRLMDEFEITSEIGRGTVVKVKKWK